MKYFTHFFAIYVFNKKCSTNNNKLCVVDLIINNLNIFVIVMFITLIVPHPVDFATNKQYGVYHYFKSIEVGVFVTVTFLEKMYTFFLLHLFFFLFMDKEILETVTSSQQQTLWCCSIVSPEYTQPRLWLCGFFWQDGCAETTV